MYVICAFIADIHRCIRRGDLIPRNENISTVLGPGFRGIANNSQSGLLITLFEVLTKRTGVCDYIFSYHTFVSCSILFSMVYIEMNFFIYPVLSLEVKIVLVCVAIVFWLFVASFHVRKHLCNQSLPEMFNKEKSSKLRISHIRTMQKRGYSKHAAKLKSY